MWTPIYGDGYTFSIEEDVKDFHVLLTSGSFPAKLHALEDVISCFEEDRRILSAAIAKAKRMRTRMLKNGSE